MDLKISFDFDHTLSELPMQELAKKFMGLGATIYVTTSRCTEFHGKPVDNSDLFTVTDALNIKRENITFTQYEDKYTHVKDYDMHFDDDESEIFYINQHQSKCMGFIYEVKPDNGIKNF